MTTLLITRGYPASGKSTLARKYVDENDNWMRVNRDDLRFMTYGTYTNLGPTREDSITVGQMAMVESLIHEGVNVVVDDTNLNQRAMMIWNSVQLHTGCTLDVVDVTTSVQDCLVRDDVRKARGERFVGKDVIQYFAQRYPMPWPAV